MGPLAGIRIIEVGGIGPAPFCGMLLADMGADVIVVDRKISNTNAPNIRSGMQGKFTITNRGKRSIAIDLKQPGASDVLLRMLANADALIEGFRPGVMERLGLGPDICLQANPKLIYGRITGWGQYGPLAQAAGHDINYIALSGALYHGAHKDAVPSAPPTLIGDVGGGGMLLAMGILAGIINARATGKGQVIDSAITDGSALMTSLLYGLQQAGIWTDLRQDNFLDSGSHWYDCYQCADDEFISIGALEPAFYNELLQRCGLADDADFAAQFDKSRWPPLKEKMQLLFRSKTQAEWCDLLEGTDVCFAPVLSFAAAADHPHNKARGTFVDIDGVTQPAPAPRFAETPSEIQGPPPEVGQQTEAILRAAGFAKNEIELLVDAGVV